MYMDIIIEIILYDIVCIGHVY